MKRFLHFVQYNNAFVLIAALFFSSAAATFAASPTAREAFYAENKKVLSVDNSYLLTVDLDTYPFDAQILAVEEDETSYYVSYSYKNIEVLDYVWREVLKSGQIKLSKRELAGRDLGLKTAEELGELVGGRRKSLKETQVKERIAGASSKVVTVEYTGLVGRFLSPDTKKFPGYVPIVDESKFAPKNLDAQVNAYEDSRAFVAQIQNALSSGNGASVANARTPLPGYPKITLLGNNPAIIEVGSSYSDLGGTVQDDKDKNLGLSMAGEWIDTSKPGEHYVRYSVTDNDGNTTTSRRLVRVVEPGAVAPEPTEDPAPVSDPGPVAPEPVVVEPTETATATRPDPEPVATSTEPAPPAEPLPQETAVEPTPPAPAPEPEPAPAQTASSTENTNASSTSNHSNQ